MRMRMPLVRTCHGPMQVFHALPVQTRWDHAGEEDVTCAAGAGALAKRYLHPVPQIERANGMCCAKSTRGLEREAGGLVKWYVLR